MLGFLGFLLWTGVCLFLGGILSHHFLEDYYKQFTRVPKNIDELLETYNSEHFEVDPNYVIELNPLIIEFLADLKLYPYKYYHNESFRDCHYWRTPDRKIQVYLSNSGIEYCTIGILNETGGYSGQGIVFSTIEYELLLKQLKSWKEVMVLYKDYLDKCPIGVGDKIFHAINARQL